MQDDKNTSKDILNLNRVIFIGRTFQEYERMFNIISSDMGKKILDCPSGASSFVAEAFNNHNCHVVGCDILYDNDPKTLEEKGNSDIGYTMEKLHQVSHLYKWDFYKSVEELREFRTNSLKEFISDYDDGKRQKRYIKAELPTLPFANDAFDIVLSSNFLFYYGDRLDYSFHLESILEFLRVSKEVRIFPIQESNTKLPEYFDRLLSDIEKRCQNISFNVEKVRHEFRIRVAKMLILSH